jgi:hypothetical protein
LTLDFKFTICSYEDPRRHAPVRYRVCAQAGAQADAWFASGAYQQERYGVADDVVLELKRYGDVWRFDEELPSGPGGHGTPPDWSKPSH